MSIYSVTLKELELVKKIRDLKLLPFEIGDFTICLEGYFKETDKGVVNLLDVWTNLDVNENNSLELSYHIVTDIDIHSGYIYHDDIWRDTHCHEQKMDEALYHPSDKFIGKILRYMNYYKVKKSERKENKYSMSIDENIFSRYGDTLCEALMKGLIDDYMRNEKKMKQYIKDNRDEII